MKHTLLTALIATLTGVGGYYLGKNDIFSRLKLEPVKSTSTDETKAPPQNKKPAFSAQAVIQVNPYGVKSHRNLSTQSMMTRQFFRTTFSSIKSEETIDKAIKEYALDELYKTDAEQLAKQISASLQLSQHRGTDLIVIETSGETEKKAQQLVYAIVNSYEARRKEANENRRNEVATKFKQKMMAQEDRVEGKRKKLYNLSKKLGIPYHGINTKIAKPDQPNVSSENKTISAEEHTQFGKIKDEYEIEFLILQKLKDAEFQETIEAGLELDPIRYHKRGWTPEVEAFMKARKKK